MRNYMNYLGKELLPTMKRFPKRRKKSLLKLRLAFSCLFSFHYINSILEMTPNFWFLFLSMLMQDKSIVVSAPEQPSEEEINPFSIFPKPEENFKVKAAFNVVLHFLPC